MGARLWLALLLMVLAVRGAAAEAGEPLAISYVPSNAIAWDIDAAIEKGFFQAEGFSAERVTFQNVVQSAQLMLTGAVQIGTGQIDPFIAAIARGSRDIAAIAAPADRPDWYLMARPEIKVAADLKGKRVGTASLQSGESWLTRNWLAGQGLAGADWELVSVGTTPLKLAALENGSIGAAIMFPPTSLAIEATGYTTLYRYYQGKPFPPVIYTVNRHWAAERDHGLRLSRALQHAHLWVLDPDNRDAAIAVLQSFTKFKPPVLEAAYDLFIAKVKLYNDDDAIAIAGVNNEVAVMVENGALPKGTTVAPELYLLPKELGGLYR